MIDQSKRDQMIDRTVTTQPQRPAVGTSRESLAFCHVRSITNPDDNFVPVRRFRKNTSEPWDGGYEYFGVTELVTAMPGYKAKHYKIYEFLGDEWSPDGNVRLLFRVGGIWYVERPPIQPITSQEMTAISQMFEIVDARPSALNQ